MKADNASVILDVFSEEVDRKYGIEYDPIRTQVIKLSADVEVEVETSVWVWDSARTLSSWLLTETGRGVVVGRSVLELGAGLGLPSIASAIAGATHVVATDISQTPLEALHKVWDEKRFSVGAVGADWTQRLKTCVLDWNECMEPEFEPQVVAEVIIACDCHYNREAVKPLIATVMKHLKPNGVFILASKEEVQGWGGWTEGDERWTQRALAKNGFEEFQKVELKGGFKDKRWNVQHYQAPCTIRLFRSPCVSKTHQKDSVAFPNASLPNAESKLSVVQLPGNGIKDFVPHLYALIYFALMLITLRLLSAGRHPRSNALLADVWAR